MLCFGRIPFYYELKIIFVLWLLSPATKGSSILYRKFVHPQLTKREKVWNTTTVWYCMTLCKYCMIQYEQSHVWEHFSDNFSWIFLWIGFACYKLNSFQSLRVVTFVLKINIKFSAHNCYDVCVLLLKHTSN